MEMDQLQNLDLSVLSSADDSRSDVSENHLMSQTQIKKLKKNYQGVVMSEEEWKIRGELESDIERELEEEIKDGIYHMALRLHRLYQHKRERKLFGQSTKSESGGHKKDKALSEVNISIKMEGGTKIEIKETKKEEGPKYLLPPRSSSSRSSRSRSNNNVIGNGSNGKKFDWAKSLRDGGGPSSIILRRIERLDQAKESSN